ncbi:MAG: right-handed parallel beta-helix repeat-containing protein [Candidatus Dormibacter sp.]
MSLPVILLGIVSFKVVATADNNGNGDHGNNRYVATNGTDGSNTCRDKEAPCRTVQHAVTVSNTGDDIQVAEGTYIEQVTITKSLEIQGAGQDRTVIQAPAVKTFDANGTETFVVLMTGGSTTVQMQQLTVSGPGAVGGGNNCGPNSASLDVGIAVERHATLVLQQSAVRNVFDQPQSGCQRGDGISIGTECYTCTPTDVGHATLRNVLVDNFQKDGVAVRGTGSTLDMRDSTVDEIPQPQIASNGIEVLAGAVGTIRDNSVTGNECNLPTICSPDPINGTQATGILVGKPGPGTSVTGNNVAMNDNGIYTDTGIQLTNNDTSANRDEGIFIDTGTTGGHINNNVTTGSNDERTPAGGYGIYVNTGVSGNTFQGDQGFGNGTYDFYDNGNADNANTFKHNQCGTAFPSRMHWDCSS